MAETVVGITAKVGAFERANVYLSEGKEHSEVRSSDERTEAEALGEVIIGTGVQVCAPPHLASRCVYALI